MSIRPARLKDDRSRFKMSSSALLPEDLLIYQTSGVIRYMYIYIYIKYIYEHDMLCMCLAVCQAVVRDILMEFVPMASRHVTTYRGPS